MITRDIASILLTGVILITAHLSPTFGKDKKKPQSTDGTTEEARWVKATNPFGLSEVQIYLEKYPKGKHAHDAKQIIVDEKTIEEIEKNGIGDRFVFPKELWPSFVTKGLEKNPKRGRSIFEGSEREISSATMVFGTLINRHLVTSGGIAPASQQIPIFPCGDRSIFIVGCKFDNVSGDAQNPLRLVYLDAKGLIVIGGRGKIFGADDNIIYQTP